MRRHGSFLVAFLIAGLFVCSASAANISATVTQDTYVTVHPGLFGPDSNHGNDASTDVRDYLLYEIGTVVTPLQRYQSFPLLSFDLGAYSGSTVAGPGTLTLTVYDTWGHNLVTQALELRPVTTSWSETVVTWNSLNGQYGSSALASGTFSVQVTPKPKKQKKTAKVSKL